jgi:hypothetical protein
MHNGGPRGCLKYETEKYWSKMMKAGSENVKNKKM